MVNIFKYGKLPRDDDVINGAKMLCVFWKADTTRMRDDRDVESKKLLQQAKMRMVWEIKLQVRTKNLLLCN